MKNAVFLVQNRVFCVWDPKLPEHNRRFLRSLDHKYFSYVAGVHARELDGEDRQRAAIALRNSYHHGLETLFTLLGAALQAPHSLPAWFLKCQTQQLRGLITDIHHQKPIRNILKIREMSWEALATKLIHFKDPADASRAGRARDLYGELWRRFANDFLNEDNQLEYNSLKHGFRMRPGGGTLKVGEPVDGARPSPEQMHTLGTSEFGTQFIHLQEIEGRPKNGRDAHIALATKSLLWNPKGMVKGLTLISLSLHNIISGLRVFMGDAPKEVSFVCPEDESAFESPWADEPRISSFGFQHSLREEHIRRFTDQELEDKLRPLLG